MNKKREDLIVKIMKNDEKSGIYQCSDRHKEEVQKTMKELEKKIAENTTWNNVNVDEFTGQFRGFEDNHTEEAKRLIEVFLGCKPESVTNIIFRELFIQRAKENALKCCNEIVRAKPLAKNLEYYESLKKAIEDYDH